MERIVDEVTGVNFFPNHEYVFPDLRDSIFQSITDQTVTAVLSADDDGVIVGIPDFLQTAADLGLDVRFVVDDVTWVEAGEKIAEFRGAPKQIAKAEERLIGMLAKPSGIATHTRRFVEAAGDDLRVVSGAWKKMPMVLKHVIRHAIRAGGADFRITRVNFVYLDKNFVRMLGGIRQTLEATRHITDHEKVIQIKGHYDDVVDEAVEAAQAGAHIVFIDTGEIDDIDRVSAGLAAVGLRDQVVIAYSGNVQLADIAALKDKDVDRVDIGRAIVDAPLLDMKLDVTAIDQGST